MIALIFDGSVRVARDVPLPAADSGEALIRVRLAGICSTDLEIVRGYKGFHGIPGHEFVGEVVECRDRSWLGKRVCGEINISCGRCSRCVAGRRTHCERREVLGILDRNGAFAQYLTLPVENLHHVPDELPDEAAVFVEPVAAAFEIREQMAFDRSSQVVVLGDGKLGLLCAQVLAATGAQVVLLGKHEHKLQLARALGIDAQLPPLPVDFRPNVVVEATGSAGGLQAALELIEPRGTIVLKTTIATPVTVDMTGVTVNEITLLGSRCGPFQPAIRALADGSVQVTPLISERYPLAEADRALQRAAQPGIVKVLIDAGTR